jgi:hypothetical protein
MSPQTGSQSGSHSCGTCRNEGLLSKMAKQQENLISTNKIILDILKQNNSSISDIQVFIIFNIYLIEGLISICLTFSNN